MEILEGVFVIIEGIDGIGNEVGFFLIIFFLSLFDGCWFSWEKVKGVYYAVDMG